jgi:hypothetical protein
MVELEYHYIRLNNWSIYYPIFNNLINDFNNNIINDNWTPIKDNTNNKCTFGFQAKGY